MKTYFNLLFSALFLLSCAGNAPAAYSYLYDGLPFEMPQPAPPVFPDNRLCIIYFCGVGDGETLVTRNVSGLEIIE